MRSGSAIAAVFALVAVAVLAAPVRAAEQNVYVVTPLTSDNGVPGTTVDPLLVNAWGLAAGPTSPWWISDNGADMSTLYNAAGAKIPLNVAVHEAPTGVVFNGNASNFLVGGLGTAARFIFSTEAGTILAWRSGSAAVVKVDSSEEGNVYKGLAIAQASTGPRLYATDFANARVEMYDGAWTDVNIDGAFQDPAIPMGYAPFGIQAVEGQIVVTFAKQTPGSFDEQHGQGLGFVDVFDTDGMLVARVAQHGQLNAPWGIAWAPENFGRFSGDLLIGNFGDGHINAYEQLPNGHFEFRGYLRAGAGQAVAIDGLWALEFGHGSANNGPTNTLFFTAGPNDEADGLFGMITAA